MSKRELFRQHVAYIERVLKNGRSVRSYLSPCCGKAIGAVIPPKGDTWDTMVVCPHCEELHWKVETHYSVRTSTKGPIIKKERQHVPAH